MHNGTQDSARSATTAQHERTFLLREWKLVTGRTAVRKWRQRLCTLTVQCGGSYWKKDSLQCAMCLRSLTKQYRSTKHHTGKITMNNRVKTKKPQCKPAVSSTDIPSRRGVEDETPSVECTLMHSEGLNLEWRYPWKSCTQPVWKVLCTQRKPQRKLSVMHKQALGMVQGSRARNIAEQQTYWKEEMRHGFLLTAPRRKKVIQGYPHWSEGASDAFSCISLVRVYLSCHLLGS